MPPDERSRIGLLQRTLDLLLLRTLLAGPAHGHAIAKQGAKGWIAASWDLSEKGKRARFFRLTPLRRKQLVAERSRWEAFSRAMALILNPADEESR